MNAAARKIAASCSLRAARTRAASALHYSGYTVPEAAARIGHDASLHLNTSAHVIDSITGQRYGNLDELIAAARADVPSAFRSSDEVGRPHAAEG